MEDLPIYEAIIKFRLRTESQGGRKRPIRTHQYGCPLFFEDYGYDCRFLNTENIILELGKEYELPIKFLCPELILPRLYVGAKVRLWEGKTIGEGEILKINETILKNL